MNKTFFHLGSFVMLIVAGGGCASMSGNAGNVVNYGVISPEPEWIRNGEPIEFEGALWYPLDSVDILVDSEVFLLDEYRGVPVYAQTVDVRPYNRIYTKFGKNKFRAFETKVQDDQSRKAF